MAKKLQLHLQVIATQGNFPDVLAQIEGCSPVDEHRTEVKSYLLHSLTFTSGSLLVPTRQSPALLVLPQHGGEQR